MNTMRLTNAFSACAAVGLALGFTVLTGAAPVRAADDEPSIDQQVMNSIMTGLGFKRDGEAQINYQERAPLVLPPNRDLPPPERTGAVTANNPAWPKDPDVERRRAEAAAERNRNVSDEREREQNPLRPDQLTPGRRGQARQQARNSDNGYDAPASGFGSQLLPSQLGTSSGSVFGAMFGNKKEDTANFTGEPPRASLTDPPVGYQTPSPEQPYGVGKAGPAKPTDYYTSHAEPSSGR
jgi:hypothetical protein